MEDLDTLFDFSSVVTPTTNITANIKADSNTNTGTSTGSRSKDPGTVEGGSQSEDRFSHEHESDSSSRESGGTDAKEIDTYEPTVDLSFLDEVESTESTESELEETEQGEDTTETKAGEKPVETASPLFNVEEQKKKRGQDYTNEDFKSDVSKPTSEAIDEALKNTVLGNALEGQAKSPRAGVGVVTEKPVNTNNITGNIEALESATRKEYRDRLQASGNELAELQGIANYVQSARVAIDDAIEQVIANTDQSYLDEIRELVHSVYPDLTGDIFEKAYNNVVEGKAIQALRNIPEFAQLEEDVTKAIQELDRRQKALTSYQSETADVLDRMPSFVIANGSQDEIRQKIRKAGGNVSGDEKVKKLESLYHEDPVFREEALDNPRSAIAPADTNDVVNALNKVADSLKVPIEQLDKSITPEEQEKEIEEVKEAVNSEGSKSYFQRILESGEAFNFDDWAKEAGWKGIAAKVGSAVVGGALAGPIGYDKVKEAITNIANNELLKRSDKPRTDEQIRDYYNKSADELENWFSTYSSQQEIENASNNYVYQRDRFGEEYNKVKQEYEDFYKDLPTNGAGEKVVHPDDIDTAEKLNAKMAEYNAIAERFNKIGDSLVENGVNKETIVKSKGSKGSAEVGEDSTIDYDGMIDEWAKSLQPGKMDQPSWMQGVEVRTIDGPSTNDFKQLSTEQKETLDNMLGYTYDDVAKLPNGKEFSYGLALELSDVLASEYRNGRMYMDYNSPRQDLSQALTDKNPKVMEVLKKAIADAEGDYTADYGTGRAALIKTSYDDAAARNGYFQANFVQNTVPQVEWLNYFDDVDINETMKVDASPSAMQQKYGDAWTDADDYHKEVAQAMEKLVPTENDPIGLNIIKSQMNRLLDNNDIYAKLVHDTYYPEYFEGLEKQKDAVEQVERNWLIDYSASVLNKLGNQEIYRIAKMVLESGPVVEEEEPTDSRYDLGLQDIYTISDVAEPEDLSPIVEGSESETEDTKAVDSNVTDDSELSEEDIAGIFGVSYDESQRKKSEYNYGLTDEMAYSDEQIKTFISGNKKDPTFKKWTSLLTLN